MHCASGTVERTLRPLGATPCGSQAPLGLACSAGESQSPKSRALFDLMFTLLLGGCGFAAARAAIPATARLRERCRGRAGTAPPCTNWGCAPIAVKLHGCISVKLPQSAAEPYRGAAASLKCSAAVVMSPACEMVPAARQLSGWQRGRPGTSAIEQSRVRSGGSSSPPRRSLPTDHSLHVHGDCARLMQAGLSTPLLGSLSYSTCVPVRCGAIVRADRQRHLV